MDTALCSSAGWSRSGGGGGFVRFVISSSFRVFVFPTAGRRRRRKRVRNGLRLRRCPAPSSALLAGEGKRSRDVWGKVWEEPLRALAKAWETNPGLGASRRSLDCWTGGAQMPSCSLPAQVAAPCSLLVLVEEAVRVHLDPGPKPCVDWPLRKSGWVQGRPTNHWTPAWLQPQRGIVVPHCAQNLPFAWSTHRDGGAGSSGH